MSVPMNGTWRRPVASDVERSAASILPDLSLVQWHNPGVDTSHQEWDHQRRGIMRFCAGEGDPSSGPVAMWVGGWLMGPGGGELGWCEVAVGGVGSVRVVVDPPVLDDDAGLEQAVLLAAVEQALVTPQTADPLVVHPPAGTAGGLRGSTPPPPRPLGRKRAQELAELALLIADRWWVEALSRAVLTDHRAGSSFRHPEPGAQHAHGAAIAVRGQSSPLATSRSTSMSSAWFATSFFNRAFSASS